MNTAIDPKCLYCGGPMVNGSCLNAWTHGKENEIKRIAELESQLAQLKSQLAQAQKCCAEMRHLLERYGSMGPTQNEILHALSSSCGSNIESNRKKLEDCCTPEIIKHYESEESKL